MNGKSLQLGSNTPLLIKIGTITINTFLPIRNKFVYSCRVKIYALEFNKLLESIFCLSACKMLLRHLKKWQSVGDRSGEYVDEATLRSPICSASEALEARRAARHCGGGELAHSVDECQRQGLRF